MQKILAVILLLLSLPLLIVVSLVILLFEFENAFFFQMRLGLHKKTFIIYKFRTMKNGRITFLGKFLRKTGIDEIPQLINIIKGNLNFIGPRPLTQIDIERLNWTSKYYNVRWNIKPGLTGLSQLSPICHKKMTLFWDKYYVNHKNMILDVKIICASFLTLIIGKKRVKAIIQKKLNK
jgi:lipopolysaccharide/colanic/teichoic acid biosynthesis glycosyltransferase